jgi:hypothetical protein
LPLSTVAVLNEDQLKIDSSLEEFFMKIMTKGSKQPVEDPEPDFLDPSDSELGLVPVPQEISQFPQGVPAAAPMPNQSTSSLDVLVQLGVGVILLGINSVNNRLRDKQPMVVVSSEPEEPLTHPDDEQNQLRYALVGLALKTPGVVSRGISRTAQLAEKG